METAVTEVRHARRPGRRASTPSTPAAAPTDVPVHHVISSMPISAAARGHGPAGARRGAGRGRRPRATATSSPSRSSCPSRRSTWPDNWIYIHDPDGRARAHPELRLVVAVHGQGGPQRPRPRVLRVRGRRTMWNVARRGARSSRPSASSRRSASSTPTRSRPATSCAMPKAYPIYDEHYQAQRRRPAELARRAHAQRAPGRPQRHVPVQQPGPLDVHRDAHRREHRHRHRPRHLGGERRGGVPRGGVGRGRARHAGAPGTGRDAPVLRGLRSRPTAGRARPETAAAQTAGAQAGVRRSLSSVSGSPRRLGGDHDAGGITGTP